MARHRIGLICLLAAVLMFASQAVAGTLAGVAPIEAYVSSRLPPAERAYVAFQIGQMPAHLRAALLKSKPADVHVSIIEGASGAVHYNRAEDFGTTAQMDISPLGADHYPGIPVPGTNAFDPGLATNTGPYRRVYTTPLKATPVDFAHNGADYHAGGVVTLGCKAGKFVHNSTHSDAGFLYLGGWSTTPNKPAGTVDAGLQYNYQLSPKSKDDYSPFVAISGTKGYVATGTHISCGTTVVVEFDAYPVRLTADCLNSDQTCHSYALGVAVADLEGKLISTAIWVSTNTPTTLGVDVGGWADLFETKGPSFGSEVRCGGCIFKFMTSIAQSKPGDYHDGASFSAKWSSKYISCFATTCDKAGDDVFVTADITDCSEFPLWTKPYVDSSRDCKNTPAAATGLASSVQVSGYSPKSETDKISLTH
jgi:hypothetical protein